MPTSQQSLKTELTTLASTLTNVVAKYRALIIIDNLDAALTAQAAGVSNTVQSYSIAGRNETFFANGDLQGTIDGLWSQLNGLLYGNATFADLRRNVLEDGTET